MPTKMLLLTLQVCQVPKCPPSQVFLRFLGGVDAIAVQLTGVGARELARHRNAVRLEGPVLGEGHLTRSLKDAGFFGGEDPLLVTTVWLSV